MSDKKEKDGPVWNTDIESLFECGTGEDMIDDDSIFDILISNYIIIMKDGVVDMNTIPKKIVNELILLIEDSARICMDEAYVGITKFDADIVANKEAAIEFSKCGDDVRDDPGFGAVVYKWGDIVFWITGIVNNSDTSDSNSNSDNELIEQTESLVVEKR